jgi:hypothetical protein
MTAAVAWPGLWSGIGDASPMDQFGELALALGHSWCDAALRYVAHRCAALYSDAECGIVLVFRDKGDGGVLAEAATETKSEAHRWHVSSDLVGNPDDHNLLVRAHCCTRACPYHSRWRMAECRASTRASTHTLARARRRHACMRECAPKQTHAPTHAAAAAHWPELDLPGRCGQVNASAVLRTVTAALAADPLPEGGRGCRY